MALFGRACSAMRLSRLAHTHAVSLCVPRASLAFEASPHAEPFEYGDGGSQAGGFAPRRFSPRPPTAPRAQAAPSGDTGAQSGTGDTPFADELGKDYGAMSLYPQASAKPFDASIASVLHAPLDAADVEIKPDGALYLPESRYRRVLNRAFGAGGWALVPRGPHTLAAGGVLSREYALLCLGRYVSQARGHAAVPAFSTPALATEVVRSNALMRLCKDLGVANELFDPAFIAAWRGAHAVRRVDNGRPRWFKSGAAPYTSSSSV